MFDASADLGFLIASAHRVVSCIGLPGVLLRWMQLTKPFFSKELLISLPAIGRVGLDCGGSAHSHVKWTHILIAGHQDGDVDGRSRPAWPLALLNLRVAALVAEFGRIGFPVLWDATLAFFEGIALLGSGDGFDRFG